jgi:hypothetical protein
VSKLEGVVFMGVDFEYFRQGEVFLFGVFSNPIILFVDEFEDAGVEFAGVV